MGTCLTSATQQNFALFQRSRLRHLYCRIGNVVPWPESDYLVNVHRKFIYCPVQKVACTSLMRWFLWSHGLEDAQIDDPGDLVLHPGLPADGEHQEPMRRLSRNYQMARLPARQVLAILAEPAFFTFAFVRNPWARLVSAYLNLVTSCSDLSEHVLRDVHKHRGGRAVAEIKPGDPTDVTFREFLGYLARRNPKRYNRHWKPQHLFFEGNRIDFIGRFETLSDDFEVVRERLKIERKLPHLNSTRYSGGAEPIRDNVSDLAPKDLLELPAPPKYPRFFTAQMRDVVARIYAKDIALFGYRFEE